MVVVAHSMGTARCAAAAPASCLGSGLNRPGRRGATPASPRAAESIVQRAAASKGFSTAEASAGSSCPVTRSRTSCRSPSTCGGRRARERGTRVADSARRRAHRARRARHDQRDTQNTPATSRRGTSTLQPQRGSNAPAAAATASDVALAVPRPAVGFAAELEHGHLRAAGCAKTLGERARNTRSRNSERIAALRAASRSIRTVRPADSACPIEGCARVRNPMPRIASCDSAVSPSERHAQLERRTRSASEPPARTRAT